MKPILVCLHGWGGSKESFTELRAALRGADIDILTPDLPGFGAEPEPDRPWTVDDYADWVEQWMRSSVRSLQPALSGVEGSEVLLLGHSHGGRIALALAARQSRSPKSEVRSPRLAHLYLCAPAGIRHPRHIKRIIGLLLAKVGAFFLSVPGLRALQPLAKKLLYTLVRVHDYERASPIMRQTMINVAARDLRPLLPLVEIPTDLFWGADDRMTPVSDGALMHREIRGSALHTFLGVRHAVHRECAKEIAEVILKSLRTIPH